MIRKKQLYNVYIRKTGEKVCTGTRDNVKKILKIADSTFFKACGDGKDGGKYKIVKLKEDNKMMSKEDFVGSLLEAQEARLEAEEEKVEKKENKTIEKPLPNKETHEKAATVEKSETIVKAFNNLVSMILAEADEKNNVYWYAKGIMSVLGE